MFVRSTSTPRRLAMAFVVTSATLMARHQAAYGQEAESTARAWQLIDGRSWQIVSRPGDTEDTATTDKAQGTRGACPPGMVDVRGAMKRNGARSVESLQDASCTEWIPNSSPGRCAQFDAAHWLAQARELSTIDLHFCIDRFEYPDQRGAYPVVAVTFDEAEATCSKNRARLCTEDEWTFACEGENALPYPYGYQRDDRACVIDRQWMAFDAAQLSPRAGPGAMQELDKLWQGEASGARPACRSPFGVYDLTGNVDEWTRSTQPGRRSILKGGYWGPVRTRCRPSTRAHGEDFFFYQQGFRCCADIPT